MLEPAVTVVVMGGGTYIKYKLKMEKLCVIKPKKKKI